MNLSKGLVGEDASALLGAMLITKLQLAAMSRVSVPEEERRDFYLYVDEFQNFATESFANILSEARKYRLNLVLAHQYITQMVEEVRDAVFGNVGTMIVFRIGAADAEFLENEFSPEFNVNDLVGLGFAQIYLKLMIDGFSSRPFSATTLPPQARPEKSHKEKIIRVSRERYGGLSRHEVEEKIARWSGVMEEIKGEKGPEKRKFQNEHASVSGHQPAPPVFIDKCWECGQEVKLNFKPDGVRPVYCKECLIRVKSQEPPKVGAKKVISEPVVRETGQAISLSEAMAKRASGEFKPVRKPRREVDLVGLRDVLKEVVGPIPEPSSEKKPAEKESGEGEELKPGEPVDL